MVGKTSMEDLHKFYESIGRIETKADAAHKRLDRLENLVREDIKLLRHDIEEGSKELKHELHAVTEYMNRGKGWAAATLILASSVGSGLAFVFSNLFRR